jgi:WD40 repeat protein
MSHKQNNISNKRKNTYEHKSQKKKKPRVKRSERIEAANATATATLDAIKNAQTQVRNIPGFYYDEQLKRYFKIDHRQANYQNHVAKTQEQTVIKKQLAEKTLSQQQHTSNHINTIRGIKMREYGIMSHSRTHDIVYWSQLKQAFQNLNNNLELHHLSQDMNDICVSNMCLFDFDRYSIPQSQFRNNCTYFIGSKQREVKLYTLSTSENESRVTAHNTIQYRSDVTSLHCIYRKDVSQTFVLSTHMGGANTSGELCLATITPHRDDATYDRLLAVKHKEIWSSAVAPDNSGIVSVGVTGGGHIFNLATSSIIYNIPSNKSDIMSQQFDHIDTNLLWNGRRDGIVSLVDARQSSYKAQNAISFFAGSSPSPVISFVQIPNTNYMITSNMKGELRCWDTRSIQPSKRQAVPVVMFDGHTNATCRNARISIDPLTNKYLFAGGDDGLLRVWDVKLGGTSMMQIKTKQQVTDIVWSKYENTQDSTTCLIGCGDNIASHLFIVNV